MTGRAWIAGLLLAATAGQVAHAQSRREPVARWNDRAAIVDRDDSPVVSLWFEGTRALSYGAPVRVWFNVSEDAHVIVARVDANGHLTVLYPHSRTQGTAVAGERDILVRGRRGVASFYATDRVGGGFVFAMASFDPFDLSRLGIRDFDRYVTGTYVGRPNEVYIGDPHRVIARFASMVNFSDASPYDYAVDFYNVDAPYYVSSAGFSNFCNGFVNGRRGLQERWDDEFYYGSGAGLGYNCQFIANCALLGFSGYNVGYGLLGSADPYCLGQRNGGVGNAPPPVPPVGDSLRVPPWLPDSIGGGRPDTVGGIPDKRTDELDEGLNSLRRGATGTEGPRGPIVTATDDPTDRSYAIPGRALRNAPSTIGQTRDRDRSPTMDGPERRTPIAEGVDWVRPPREVVEGPRNPGDGLLPRSPRQRAEGPDRLDRPDRSAQSNDGRGGRPTFVNPSGDRGEISAAPPRFDPPSRGSGPRFDSPPPNVRTDTDGPRFYTPPPPRFDSPRFDAPGGAQSGGGMNGWDRSPSPRAEPVRADPPGPAPAPSPAPPAAGAEKKSDSKQP